MKNFIYLLLVTLLLFSCEASDSIQGDWKALNANGEKFEIHFSPNKLSIKSDDGENSYGFNQTGIKYENSTYTYSISLDDGRGYQIYFPKKDKLIGLILDENGTPLYTIGRQGFVKYEEIYKLD